jgi:hypothetical protein
MRQPKKTPAEALVILAKASLGGRRRWTPLRAIIVVLLFALLLSVCIWWLWPRPHLPQLIVAAYDDIAVPGERVQACAQVQPIMGPDGAVNLAGCEIYFQESRSADAERRVTGSTGIACVEKTASQNGDRIDIAVRYRGEPRGHRSDQANGRVFVWPASTRILVIDIDHTLLAAGNEQFWQLNNLDVRASRGAAKALQEIGRKYRIAYMSAGASGPVRYNKLRAWLGMRGREAFPDGPLLAPVGPFAVSAGQTFAPTLAVQLVKRYPNHVSCVSANRETLQAFQESGAEAFWHGAATAAPKGMVDVKSWADLPRTLGK